MAMTGDQSFLEATRREMAIFASDMMGAQRYVDQFAARHRLQTLLRFSRQRQAREILEATTLPSMLLDPRPRLHIIETNAAYAAAPLTDRHRTAGEKLFDVFPDNPSTPTADGVSNLFESIHKAAQSRATHVMPVQRYDVRDESGDFVVRYWRPRNIPIFDERGKLIFVLHQAEMVGIGRPA